MQIHFEVWFIFLMLSAIGGNAHDSLSQKHNVQIQLVSFQEAWGTFQRVNDYRDIIR